MNLKKPLVLVVCVLFIGLTVGISNKLASEDESTKKIELDYTNLESAVIEVLNEMPDSSVGIRPGGKGLTVAESKVKNAKAKDSLNKQKTKFRLKLESKLSNKNYSEKELDAMAEKSTNNLEQAIAIAESVYGVEVSQEEVTKYIDENVAVFVSEEKERYAKSLGLTTHELDYTFDRDFYVIDTLWEKLIPVLMDKHPKNQDEKDDEYLQRIKDEFYSHTK